MNSHYSTIMVEYLTNFLCFIALSTEVFSILFMYDLVKNIAALLLVDAVVFIGVLFARLRKMDLKGKER